MNKYQVTINLVVEVEADTEDEACQNAGDCIDYERGDVVEEDIMSCELLELRCCECDEELDPDEYGCYDEVLCHDCESKLEVM